MFFTASRFKVVIYIHNILSKFRQRTVGAVLFSQRDAENKFLD